MRPVALRELEFIDSSGLALLARLLPAQADGVRRVFALTGLDQELPFSEHVIGVPPTLELEAT